jgi:hypothetical protein
MKLFVASIILFCLVLCKSDEKSLPLSLNVDRLWAIQHKEQIISSVNYAISGCFGGELCRLTIFREDGCIKARLASSNRDTLISLLDATQVKAYYHFIHELRARKMRTGCTTETNYIVTTPNEKFNTTDGGCWEGLENLRYTLFPNRPN